MSTEPKRHRFDELALAPLARRAWRRGVLGGERKWLAAGILVWLLRRIRRRKEDVVYSETLTKGHYLQISHLPPLPTRRARRKAKRRARRRTERTLPAQAPVLAQGE